jgi:hypothetical protein
VEERKGVRRMTPHGVEACPLPAQRRRRCWRGDPLPDRARRVDYKRLLARHALFAPL